MGKYFVFYVKIAFAVISGILLCAVCTARTVRVSVEETDRWINGNIPVGSTKDEVVAFLESATIKSLRAEHNGFVPHAPDGTDARGSHDSMVRGYLVATIQNAADDRTKLQVYRIRIVFYFGDDQRLMDHRIQMLGDW